MELTGGTTESVDLWRSRPGPQDMWSIMKNCKENRDECIESAKETLGAALGEMDISTEELEKRIKDAMRSDLAESMAACVKRLGMHGVAENRSHSKGERNLALKEAGTSAARDVVKMMKEVQSNTLDKVADLELMFQMGLVAEAEQMEKQACTGYTAGELHERGARASGSSG
eukprot:Skav211654  [mRNA]  locus=scaffold2752:33829:40491:- [translate_table: standard]